MKKLILIISLWVLGFMVLIFVTTRSAQAQLGGLDNCDVFYRLSKHYLGWYDVTPNYPQEYDPTKSQAFSTLYLACRNRNGEVTHGQ